MVDNKKWTWEPPVFFKADPEFITDLKERFVDIRGVLEKSRTKTATIIWLSGLETLENDPELADKLQSGNLAITKAYNEIIQRQANIKRLNIIFDSLCNRDPEDWCNWCCSNEVSEDLCNLVLKYHSPSHLHRRQKATAWLSGLLSDHQPYKTSEIRVRAVESGIISEDDKDWGWLRQIAAEKGWSQKADHGAWSL